MEQNRREFNKRKMALSAFAKSVKKAGKFEWGMTIVLFLIFGGFIAFFAVKFMNLPDWALYIAFGIVAFIGFYVGYEIYLSRLIRGNELTGFLEMSSLLSHVIEKLERIETALVKELDLVIGIKKDVTKNENEKVEISKITAQSVQEEAAKAAEANMVFKYCPFDDEEVYVAKAMNLCPFCWNELKEIENPETNLEESEAESVEVSAVPVDNNISTAENDSGQNSNSDNNPDGESDDDGELVFD